MALQNYFSDMRRIAYDQTPGNGPGVFFLGGFNSNKEGTKALALEDWAKIQGRAYMRFDYSGHGASAGEVADFTLGDWIEDAAAIFGGMTEGPQILVGSSMGAWIALVLAARMPERVAGLVTVAAAPDFTERHYLSSFSDAQRAELEQKGQVAIPSEYSDTPYIITKKLIDAARRHLILTKPIHLPFPTRFLMGTDDAAVSIETTMRLLDCAEGSDVQLPLVKDADHGFSDTRCLSFIKQSIENIA